MILSRCGRRDRDAGGEPELNREVRRVVDGDQHAAVADELLQVGQALPAHARAHVVGRIDLADVRRQLGRLPRQGIAVHRQAGDELLAGAAADRRKEDDVVLGREVGVLRDILRADVVVGHGDLVERQAPPAFVLRVDPGVQQRDARGLGGVRLHRRRRGERHGLEPEVGDGLAEIRGADAAADDERPAVELLSLGLERLLGDVDLRVLEAIAQRRERRVGVVVDGEEAARAADAASGRQLALDELERRVEHLRRRVTRTTLTLNSSPNVQPCRRRGSAADRRAPSTGSRAACRRCGCRADPCAARRCRPGTCASRAGAGLSVAGLPAFVLRDSAPARRSSPLPAAPRRWSSRAPGGFLPGSVTVKGAVARETSQPCSCRMRSRSACGPSRGSSPGTRRPPGPSVFGLQDRALALQVEVLEKEVLVVGEVVERDEQPRLLVVVVVPLRPLRLGQRRVLLVPGARGVVRARACARACRRRRCRTSRTAG